MSLQKEIDEMRQEIRTDGYSMSVGEWISLYEKNEIDIHPEFQRIYRWSPYQKSNFIESMLLGIPIPPVFVSQRKDGVWDVVDGLQRLSTIFEFVGILRDETGKKLPPLVLQATKYLPSTSGMRWDGKDEKKSFSQPQRLLLKRSKIAASIILKESDDLAKYELFQRLNTGGSLLTAQEVRNCIMVMINREFYQKLRKLTAYQPFQDCIALSDRPLEGQYDVELVLRYAIFSNLDVTNTGSIGDVGAFLTDKMIEIARDKAYDFGKLQRNFQGVFRFLQETTGADSFRRYDHQKKKFVGGFIVSAFEAVALGLSYNYPNKMPTKESVLSLIASIWKDQSYTTASGSGITATRRLPKLLPYGRRKFAK